MADYIVANCETAEFNGTYIQVDPSSWEKSAGWITYYLRYDYGPECMELTDSFGFEVYFDNNYGGNLPPDDPSIVWWNLNTDTASALTVTAAGGGAQNLTLSCASGSYSQTGSSVTPFAALKPVTDYMLTDQYFGWFGFPVNYFPLEATSANVDYSLACNAGSYTLTGSDATLDPTLHYSLACNSGAYVLTGTDVSFGNTIAYSLACNSGSYILTGLEADLFKRLVMPCGAGSYILTGTDAGVNANYVFALNLGSYVLVGMDAGLFILTATPDCRTYFIDAENRTWLINSEDRTRVIDAENRTMEVRCH